MSIFIRGLAQTIAVRDVEHIDYHCSTTKSCIGTRFVQFCNIMRPKIVAFTVIGHYGVLLHVLHCFVVYIS